jgi:hypothetical protein
VKKVQQIQDESKVAYQSVPQPKLQSKLFTNWSFHDRIMIVVIGAFTFTGWLWGELVGVALVGFVLLPLLYRAPTGYGRLYSEIATWFRGYIIMHLLKGVIAVRDDDSNWFIRMLRRRFAAVPFRIGRIQAEIDGQVERFAVLEQTDRPYLHLFAAASGGAFASQDVNLQTESVNELARLCNLTATESDLKVGISYLRMTGPFDHTIVNSYYRWAMNPLIASKESFKIEDERLSKWIDWQRSNFEKLIPTAIRYGASLPWYLIIITIKRTSEWDRASSGKLDNDRLASLPIIELGRSLVSNLGNSSQLNLDGLHILTLPELSHMMRAGYDVVDISKYYARRSQGLIPMTDEEVDQIRAKHGDAEVDKRLETWTAIDSIEVSEKDSFVRLGKNFVSTLRITQLPPVMRTDKIMGLHFLARVGQWTRMAWVGEAVKGSSEMNQALVAASAEANVMSAFASRRIFQDPRKLRKTRQLLAQSEEFSYHSLTQHYNVLYPIVASSQKELLKARKQLKGELENQKFKVEIVHGAARQIDAAYTGMFGVNRM